MATAKVIIFYCVIASEKAVWFESISKWSDESSVTSVKLSECWSHLNVAQ